MKKFFIRSLILGAVLVGMVASAITPTHFTARSITGTYLCLSNATTITGGSTFALGASSNFWYYSYALGTNVLVGSTNSYGNVQGSPISDLALYPDANVDVNPNLSVQVVLGYTNQLFLTGVQTPVMYNTVWTNPVPVFTNATAGTNQVTFTFVPVSSGEFGLGDTVASKAWSFTVWQTNGIPTVLSTNLPTSLLQGASALRWSATNANTGTTPGPIINAVNLTGWKP